jgi:glycopeptide antibiotics resistance protein
MFARLFQVSIGAIWPSLIIFSVTLITTRIFYLISHRERFCLYRELLSLGSILYVVLLFQLLINTEVSSNAGFNLVPFKEITRYTIGSNLFKLNVLGNIILFIPMGCILTGYLKPKNIIPIIVSSIIISSTVELVQLGIGRAFDVDDIILNLAGAIIGYLLYSFLRAIYNKLPKFLQKDGLYNVICIIIIAGFVIYIMKILGVLNF